MELPDHQLGYCDWLYTLVLDGEIADVVYAWYMDGDDNVTFEAVHLMEEDWE